MQHAQVTKSDLERLCGQGRFFKNVTNITIKCKTFWFLENVKKSLNSSHVSRKRPKFQVVENEIYKVTWAACFSGSLRTITILFSSSICPENSTMITDECREPECFVLLTAIVFDKMISTERYPAHIGGFNTVLILFQETSKLMVLKRTTTNCWRWNPCLRQ